MNGKNKIQVDPVKVSNLKALVEVIVDEGRLEQGISKLREDNEPIEIKSMGKYLKWLVNDTMKEEMDTIISNGFEPKEINGYISTKGRLYFINYLNELSGL